MDNLRYYNKYILYIISLFISSLGVALSVKANLGTSALVAIPNVLSIAFPYLTIGTYSIIFNILLVLSQIIILRNKFEKIQLLQIIVAVIYGYFIDLSIYLLSPFSPFNYVTDWIFCIIGSIILALGVFIQLELAIIYLPIDGFVLSVAYVRDSTYSKIKPFNDIALIIIAAVISLFTMGGFIGVREGTIFAAIFVGPLVGFFKKHLSDYTKKLL